VLLTPRTSHTARRVETEIFCLRYNLHCEPSKDQRKTFPFFCVVHIILSPLKKKNCYIISRLFILSSARLYYPFHFCVLCDGGNECRRRRMDNAQCQYVAAVYGQLPTAKERPKLNVSTFTIYIIQSDLVSSSYRSVAAIQIHTDD
jgi:hypothetical protein